ncbi:putative pyridine nucleotide-disulfide oxidoreductase [Variovorax paradoxus B4]|uniref:Putative pyridine nucleotide-disulfide oxidoreductase n=1 Tax=Variovorax paradoxus B4 TaxID=1246301 RepID=T1X4Z6_VARPD|nr:NAD(P)/FAD-dependent oxidoreductase [Variovorax paradoxus]AGU47235.1 putative pyridine nucleotide-disulfide oxidoreductase [Variovorax paradoxus B4]
MHYDALVVGGSFAGLSAALQLARARKTVCIVDAGAPRNRFAAASHGFFGQDGTPPLKMIADARAKVLAYPNASFVEGRVAQAHADGAGGFAVSLEGGGAPLSGSRIVLAFGVEDGFPEIEGVRERWGRSVLHCPYCHGYEVGGRRLGILIERPHAPDHAILFAEWGSATLFLNGNNTVDEETRARLQARGVAIEPGRIAALEGPSPAELSGVRLADGRRVPLDAMFLVPRTRLASPLAEQLGCVIDEGGFGPLIRTDAMKMTTVPGVFAAGDAAMMFHNATLASADGVMAGISLHRASVFGN